MLKTIKPFYALILLALLMQACGQKEEQSENMSENLPDAPVAAKKDSVLSIHGDTRTDPYFWMRLTDEQKNAENPDEQTQAVLAYLRAENEYTNTAMKGTEELQEKLYNEMVGRIKQTAESLPYFKNGDCYGGSILVQIL